MPELPEHLLFFIEKTKDPTTNWIFLEELPRISGISTRKKKFKPCATCNKCIPVEYQYENIYGRAVKCRAWEKPNKKNYCSYYESKYYNPKT